MRIALMTALCFAALTASVCQGQAARSAKARAALTYSQIEALVRIDTPDDVISQEIHDRGIARPPNRADLDRLTARGAGAQTIAALRALAKGTVNVISHPGECEVLIDGKVVGRTRTDGRLSVADVAAGEHSVRVQKEGFQNADFPVTVDAGGQASVAAALETARGSLSVLASVPEATIRINGLGTYQGAAKDIRCPAGSYVVDVTAPRYAPVQQTVAVAAGQTAEISIKLELDPAFLDELRQQLRAGSTSQNPQAAMRVAEELLRYAPSDPDGNAALAVGQFASGNLVAFRSTAPKALSLGGTIALRLVHHHAFMNEHAALLVINSGGLVFDALGAPCSLRAGRIPADRITLVRMVRERVRGTGPIAYADYINIEFRPVGRDDKTESMKFTAAGGQARMLGALVEVVSGIARR
jgi:PEGA domain